MRRVTRNLVVGLLLVAVLLLALGALPAHLRAGDPYYVTATPVDDPGDRAAVNGSALSERRYPYVTDAVAAAGDADGTAGRSDPYWEGPLGIKGTFTHSPFDEFDALRQQYPDATADGDGDVYLRENGTLYRLSLEEGTRT